jgi:hypothetical protein
MLTVLVPAQVLAVVLVVDNLGPTSVLAMLSRRIPGLSSSRADSHQRSGSGKGTGSDSNPSGALLDNHVVPPVKSRTE